MKLVPFIGSATRVSRLLTFSRRYATAANPVVDRIKKKREDSALGGGPKRIAAQHEKVLLLNLCTGLTC
jgi:hypothetical protein